MNKFKKNKKGQVMIVVSLSLGGVMIISSLVGGILILNQLRQSKNLIDSAKSIYAADAALNWGLYQFMGLTSADEPSLDNNKTKALTKCFNDQDEEKLCNSPDITYIIGIGQTSLVSRALKMSF